MAPTQKSAETNVHADVQTFLRVSFSGSKENIARDTAAFRAFLSEFLLKRFSIPTEVGYHYVIADSTNDVNEHIGSLAGIAGVAIWELLNALEQHQGTLDILSIYASGQYDDPDTIMAALKEMNKNLAAVKKLLGKKRKKRA